MNVGGRNSFIFCDSLQEHGSCRFTVSNWRRFKKNSDIILSPLQIVIETHSVPLLKITIPWAIKNEIVPDIRYLGNELIGSYAQPLFRWVHWAHNPSLRFIMLAVAFSKGYQLRIDEGVLRSQLWTPMTMSWLNIFRKSSSPPRGPSSSNSETLS